MSKKEKVGGGANMTIPKYNELCRVVLHSFVTPMTVATPIFTNSPFCVKIEKHDVYNNGESP